MPISYAICGNGHIEHIIISEPWTLENLIELYAQRRYVLDGAVHKMQAMAVLRDVQTIPLGAISWACAERIERHPNLGYTAVLGCSRLLRGVGETVLQLARYDRARFFKVESEAWEFLYSKIGDPALVG